ncbi:MAG: LPS export ABC transporter permease LptF [Halofilum sp. (in: g-proteobacteria)]
MPLTLIDRYLLREIVQTSFAVTAVLLLILLTNSLAYMLGKVVEGDIAVNALLPLFLTNVSVSIVPLVPLSLFLGVLLSFGRLYSDSEMSALGACGVGQLELFRPVLVAGLIGALITGGLAGWVSPWAKRAEHDITVRMAERSELAAVVPGRFNRSTGADVVLFAEGRDEDGDLSEVFVEAEDGQGETILIRARGATQRTDADTGWSYLEFQQGFRYSGEPGTPDFREIEFAEHGIRIPQRRVQAGEFDRDARTLTRLWQAGDAESTAELQWRVAVPLSCLLLALAAAPLSHTTPRKGRYGKVAVALVIYLVYSNLLVFARNAVAEGTVPPVIGVWWVHLLTLAVIAGLVIQRAGWRWTRDVLSGRARLMS